jgi:porin
LPINLTFSAGIGGKGLIPNRENDQLGVGFFYGDLKSGRLTERAGIEDAAQGLEAFYNIFLTGSTNLTLDVQLLDSLRSSVKDPTILGARLYVNF